MTTGDTIAAGCHAPDAGRAAEALIWGCVDRMSRTESLDDALQILTDVGARVGFVRPAFVEDVADNRCATARDGRRLLEHVGWSGSLMDRLGDLPFTHRHPAFTVCLGRDAPFAMEESAGWRIWSRLATEQRLLRDEMSRMGIEAFACVPLHRSRGRVAAVIWAVRDAESCADGVRRYGAALQALASQFMDCLDALHPAEKADPMPLLTPRQIDCLHHAAQGATAEETARALGLSPFTVRQHLKEVCERLGARNLSHAVAIACCNGTLSEIMPRSRRQ